VFLRVTAAKTHDGKLSLVKVCDKLSNFHWFSSKFNLFRFRTRELELWEAVGCFCYSFYRRNDQSRKKSADNSIVKVILGWSSSFVLRRKSLGTNESENYKVTKSIMINSLVTSDWCIPLKTKQKKQFKA